jgi:hypothetical protein
MPYTIKITENVAPGIPAVTLRLPGQPIHFVKGNLEADHRGGVEIVATESRTVEQIVAGLRRDGYEVTEDGAGDWAPSIEALTDLPLDTPPQPEPEPEGARPPADPFTPEEADPLRRPLTDTALGPHVPEPAATAPVPAMTSTSTTAGPARGGKTK